MGIADTISHLLGSATYINVILLLVSSTSEHLVLVIGTINRTPDIHIGKVTIIQRTDFTLISNEIVRTQDFSQFGYLFKTERSTEVYLRFTFFSALSSNDDYTICTTGTINGCGRSIFQYVDALNFRGGDITNA